MKLIKAYETPDKQRFFDEEEARKHERRYDYGNHVDLAVKSRPEFARLDRELLLDFLMQHGQTIGKLAESPIKPTHDVTVTVRNPASALEKAPRFGHTGGLVGERPAARVGAIPNETIASRDFADRRAEGMEPAVDALNRMADDIAAELHKDL